MTDHPKSQKYSQGFPKSILAFSSLSDPRSGNATFHYFGEVIFIELAALIAQCEGLCLHGTLRKKQRRVVEKVPHPT